jgi:hypothetical protein
MLCASAGGPVLTDQAPPTGPHSALPAVASWLFRPACRRRSESARAGSEKSLQLTFATITNENREAAPRLRLVGAFPTRKHTTVAFTP